MRSWLAMGTGLAAVMFGAASGGLAAAQPAGSSFATRCSGIEGKSLAGAVVTKAEHVAAGSTLPPLPTADSPAFCRVRAEAVPVAGSRIKLEIWLPDTWNGKLAGIGGGGFEGGYTLANIVLRMPVRAGFAGVVTDAGHDRAIVPKWAFGQPEKIADFGNRANHVGAVVAKAVAADYYGAPVKRALFHGCSNGGRDALMLAQRYPRDYDAIVVGAPANDFSGLMASFGRLGQLGRGTLGKALEPKLKLVRDAAVARCDGLDGARDGLIGNPAKCRFDPAVLACKAGASGETCLSKTELSAVKAVYADSRLRDGTLVMPGLPPGSEGDWSSWLTGSTPQGAGMATAFYRNFVHSDDSWSAENFDIDREWKAGRATVSNMIDALDPDLRPFLGGGGKLLMYHGWNDAAIPAGNSIRYFESMRRTVGSRLAGATRLFMLPGVGHCTGGSGPDTVDYLAEIDRWAESGIAPDQLTATKFESAFAAYTSAPGKALRSRPACAWPKAAQYRGSGSMEEAGSYVCR